MRDLRHPVAMADIRTRASMLPALKRSTPPTWIAFAAVFALVVASGCATQVRSKLEESFAARKIGSLSDWETALTDGKPLLKGLQARTALLFRNYESVSVKADGDEFHLDAGTRLQGAGFGAAVPVAQDGYFLTAGHVVSDALSLILVAFSPKKNGNPLAYKAPARIVWGPVQISPGHDIAVVHAPDHVRQQAGFPQALAFVRSRSSRCPAHIRRQWGTRSGSRGQADWR